MNDPSAPPAAASDVPAAASPEAPPRPRAAKAGALSARLALVISLAAVALAAWQWHDERGRSEALRQELAKRLADADTRAKEARFIAEQVRAAASDVQVKLGVLENRVAESQGHQIALEALYQELSRNRDEWTYADIDQSLLIASQQLQLAGNVKAALIALQNVDARLQRMERPQFVALRKAINRDIERLKAVPHVDTVGISIRLDELVAAVDSFPLAADLRPEAPAAGAAPAADDGPWLRFWREVRDDLRQLIRVQRMDRPDPPLLAPGQSYFLRENLKLRLIAARLALLGRNEANYKGDLKAAQGWIERYFDKHHHQVGHALGQLRTLHAAEISIDIPSIAGTLDALRNLRAAPERGGR